MAGSSNIGEDSDNPVGINVTAMVDVIFCLCLFFMCSFHFRQLEGKIDTWLPKDRGIFGGQAADIIKNEIVIVLRMAADGSQVIRRVRNQQAATSDQDLMSTVLQIASDYDKAGDTKYPLVIDASPNVPWQDVVRVMDLCKQNKIERIEFGAPERAITQ